MEYKCPNCSGAINFDTSIQKMKCPYCDTEFEMDTLKGYDDILKGDKESDMNWKAPEGKWEEGERDSLCTYSCKSCGGEIVGDENLGATACPYCGNPVVMSGMWEAGLRPDLVIPFKLDKKQAKQKFAEYLGGKFLLPSVFKGENKLEEIKGVYVPFWLFDADTSGRMRFKATKTRFWSDSDYNYTEVKYYSVVRGATLSFKGVPADGSAKIDDVLMQSLEPFDMREAVDFQTAYLAGFLADKYDVEADKQIDTANARIKKSTENAILGTVSGYSGVQLESSNLDVENGKTSYALYPVWLMTTKWRDKIYMFAMNGQTGKFVGDLPVDTGKRTMLFAGVTVLVSIICFLITLFIF